MLEVARADGALGTAFAILSRVSPHASLVLGAALALAIAGCATNNADAPPRSPSQDYPPPPPTTSDGQVVGADGVDPADRLKSGARVGTENAMAPGWQQDEQGLRYDPNKKTDSEQEKKPKKKP